MEAEVSATLEACTLGVLDHVLHLMLISCIVPGDFFDAEEAWTADLCGFIGRARNLM